MRPGHQLRPLPVILSETEHARTLGKGAQHEHEQQAQRRSDAIDDAEQTRAEAWQLGLKDYRYEKFMECAGRQRVRVEARQRAS